MAAFVQIGYDSTGKLGITTWIGASTDTKPSSGLAYGSRAYEYNTGYWFVTHDGGATWTRDNIGEVLVTGVGEVQATPTANTILSRLKTINDTLSAGAVVSGSMNPPTQTIIVNPFGKGALTVDGVQYSTEVTGILHTAYGAVETVTIAKPAGYAIEEITFGLTMAIASSGATKHVKWKFQGSDAGTDWVDLIAAQTRAANASAYADVSASGRFVPAANFLLTGTTFQVRGVIQAEDAGETAKGKMKNSSFVILKYRRS